MSDTPTRDEILAELDQLIERYPEKNENDITSDDIMASREIGHTAAMEFMKKMVRMNPDKYEMIKVKSDSSNWRWVLRKKMT